MNSPTEPNRPTRGLWPRVVTAIVGVPILLAVILFGPHWLWSLVVVAAVALGLGEFYGMTLKPDERAVSVMGMAMGSLLSVMMAFSTEPMYVAAGCATIVVVMFLAVLFSYREMERAIGLMTISVAGVLYVALLTGFMALVRRDPGEMGRYLLLLLLASIWMGDTGAFFAGRFLGKHKLSPVVSPKKTWEGAIGGLLASVLAAFAVQWLTPLSLHPLLLLALVVPAAILGQLGDLCESLIKRSCGVKDSGKIIYGHGGILDRIDALMFAAPYVYFFYVFNQPYFG